ncbi:MAG: DNA polymerase-1 [Verrucomicrobiales bacterium]|jgi:DNA polymerase-1
MPNNDDHTLYLLDAMALIYRAHFALIRSPIFTSDGVNTSALFGFTNTLLDLIDKRKPTHIAVAFDTSHPTERHKIFPAYKEQRDALPEDIAAAIPVVKRLVEAFGIPVLVYPGYEADDVIGTLATQASKAGYTTYMVTPDKDYAQLVDEQTYMFKPGRQGGAPEIFGVEEIKANWEINEPGQVVDILGLWGDASDNIPGVPGIGEKTAKKLIAKYGSIEELYTHTDELKGKQKENVEANRDQAFLSKQLVTINREVPVAESLDSLVLGERNPEQLEALMVEFELNQLGKRLLGKAFQAGRGDARKKEVKSSSTGSVQLELVPASYKTIENTKHDYRKVITSDERKALIKSLRGKAFCFDTETTGLDSTRCRLIGIAFSQQAGTGAYAVIDSPEALEDFRPLFEEAGTLKIGHNLKFDLSVLHWQGVRVTGPFFDTMIAHFLVESDQRHTMDFMAEVYLGYQPVPITALIGEKGAEQLSLLDVDVEKQVDYAAEDADITFQLYQKMEPLLKERGQEETFYTVEMPVMPVLVEMEAAGIALDTAALANFSAELSRMIQGYEADIYALAGCTFNLNSPKQLGEILFERMNLIEKPKKTRTGQYSTSEQVLTGLAPHHEIVQKILSYREASKLKSTYVDALPGSILPKSGRVHTTYTQTGAITGRLSSNNPNLQNIPIRSELGQEIRKGFVPREGYTLMAADYSQIELRVMASISKDPGMIEAFEQGLDIHAATAAKVYGVPLPEVTSEMRRKSKMVNFGIIYGITAFGLSQRLGIPRKEASEIIESYLKQYPGVKKYMDDTVAFCEEHGYVATMCGRRRYLRDINSRNKTIQNAARRNAMNSPIQGTAADMIKIAMTKVQAALAAGKFKTRMLLQVHDELVFDLWPPEEQEIRGLVQECMQNALALDVPIVVDIGTGENWLVAH